jgi:hypothetical protein
MMRMIMEFDTTIDKINRENMDRVWIWMRMLRDWRLMKLRGFRGGWGEGRVWMRVRVVLAIIIIIMEE